MYKRQGGASGRHNRVEINAAQTANKAFAVGADTIRFQIGGVGDSYEKMRIHSDGKVGIGTAAPVGKLHVLGSSYNHLELESAAGNVGITFDVETSNTNYYDWRIDAQGTVANGLCIGHSTGLGNGAFNAANMVMTLKSDGKVGIGTTTPDQLLHVEGTVALSLLESTGAGQNAEYQAKSTTRHWSWGTNIGASGGVYEIFDRTAGSTRFVVDTSGNVGINDSTPSYKLDVNGTGRFVGAVDFNTNVHIASGANLYLDGGSNTFIKENGADNIAFTTAGTERVRITQGGNVGIGTSVAPQALTAVSYTHLTLPTKAQV